MAIHVSEADAARNFIGLLAKVRDGEEVIIETGSSPVAVLRRHTTSESPRLLADAVARAGKRAEDLGYEPAMDDDFARDMHDIVRLRYERPRRSSTEWD